MLLEHDMQGMWRRACFLAAVNEGIKQNKKIMQFPSLKVATV